MSNTIPETMIYQQRYHEMKRGKCLEKCRQYFEENEERLQKMAYD